MSRPANPVLIGSFVLGGFILLVIFLLLIAGGSLFRDQSRLVVVFDGSISGLSVGSNVMFRGVPIGYVSGIEVMADYGDMTFTVPVYIDVNNAAIKAIQGESFGDPKVIDRLIEAGLRAELNIESLITGKLYVELDFYPDSPVLLRSRDSEVREIPSKASGIQTVIADARAFLERLQEETDIGVLLQNFAGALAGLNELANSDDLRSALAGANALMNDPALRSLGADAALTLAELRDTLASAQALLGSAEGELQPIATSLAQTLEQASGLLELAGSRLRDDSDLAWRLNTTLREVEQAARSFRVLAEYLQQDPNALIRGKDAASP